MKKSKIVFMVVLFVFVVMLSYAVSAACCANIDAIGIYGADNFCTDYTILTIYGCCLNPSDLYSYGTDAGSPTSKEDCMNNYWSDDSCAVFEPCKKGCCVDLTQTPKCSPQKTKNECAEEGAEWYSTDDGTCFVSPGYVVNEECVTTTQVACSELSEAQCTANDCYLCDNSCVGSCSICSGKPNVNANKVCVAETAVPSCSSYTQTDCTQPQSNCKWCPAFTTTFTTTAAACMDSCSTCDRANREIVDTSPDDGTCDIKCSYYNTNFDGCKANGCYYCSKNAVCYSGSCSQCINFTQNQNNKCVNNCTDRIDNDGDSTIDYIGYNSIPKDPCCEVDTNQSESACTPTTPPPPTIPDCPNNQQLTQSVLSNYNNQCKCGASTLVTAQQNLNNYCCDGIIQPSQCTQPQAGACSITLNVDDVLCEKALDISWTVTGDGCQDSVVSFFLYRDNQLIGTFNKDTSSYKDNDEQQLEWQESYHYTIKAILSNDDILTDEKDEYLGDADCEGKCTEFCMDDGITPASCDYENNLVTKDACSYACIGPTTEGTVECVAETNCQELGVPFPNVLGMFYYPFQEDNDDAACLEDVNGELRYCYYDTSETTVDSCQDCDPDMTCGDYKSEESCLQDNCMAAPYEYVCKWHSDIDSYGELGEGLCYAAVSGEPPVPPPPPPPQCDTCEIPGGCTQTICSLLVDCYASDDNSKCVSCTDTSEPATCYTYTTQAACTDDVCSLGVCEWINNKCVRDSDDDGDDDCQDFVNKVTYPECIADSTPPVTSVSLPEYINYTGNYISFTATDAQDSIPITTYYCNGISACNPTTTAITSQQIKLDHTTFPQMEDLAYIRYYSIDKYDNIEQIKTSQIYVDTIIPAINLKYAVLDSITSSTASNLTVNITTSELATCSASLTGKASINNLETSPTIKAQFSYDGLSDGTYILTITCEDKFENRDTTSVSITTDRVKGVYGMSPDHQVFNINTVNISMKTKDGQFKCYYKDDSASGTFTEFTTGRAVGSDYEYNSTLTNLISNRTYTYNIKCCSLTSTDSSTCVATDTATIKFALDNTPPVSSLYYQTSGSYAEIPAAQTSYEGYKGQNFKIKCDDTDYGDDAGWTGYNCSSILYCTVALPAMQDCAPSIAPSIIHSITPPTLIGYTNPITVNSNTTICYLSTDTGNNAGLKECKFIQADAEGPGGTITVEAE